MEATLTFIILTNYQEGTSAKGPWKKQECVFETREQPDLNHKGGCGFSPSSEPRQYNLFL